MFAPRSAFSICLILYFAPARWGLDELDGLLVPPGKASNLLTDHPVTG